MTRWAYLSLILALAGFGVAAYAQANASQIPGGKVPIHWNIHGQVDGYGPPAVAAFLVPAIMAALLALFWALPWLSPKQFETDTFRGTYCFIMFVIIAVMSAMFGICGMVPCLPAFPICALILPSELRSGIAPGLPILPIALSLSIGEEVRSRNLLPDAVSQSEI